MKFIKILIICVLLITVQFKAGILDYRIFDLSVFEKTPHIVTVTTYTVTKEAYTKSGFIVNGNKPFLNRIIAVSHDLKEKFNYGEHVLVTGIGEYSGIYIIRDLMNERWTNRIDILINPDGNHTKLFNAKLYKMQYEMVH